jgi:hypothetical protein
MQLKKAKRSRFLTCEELQERWQFKEIDVFAMTKLGHIECFGISAKGDDITTITAEHITLEGMKNGFFLISAIKEYEEEHPGYKPKNTNLPNEHPPYLDKKDLHFSRELSIAIETWLAIYGPDGKLNPIQKHKKQIIAHLKKHHPNLSASAVDRISTMINVDAPGAPKITF